MAPALQLTAAQALVVESEVTTTVKDWFEKYEPHHHVKSSTPPHHAVYRPSRHDQYKLDNSLDRNLYKNLSALKALLLVHDCPNDHDDASTILLGTFYRGL